MVDFGIIEADFQQYYGLDLELSLNRGFQRYARLLTNLPIDSRFMLKYRPEKDWNFDKETQSRILMSLDVISCQLANMYRKKGKKARKPSPQFEPEYVTKAKKNYARAEKQKQQVSKEEMANIKDFWRSRNPNAKLLEGNKNGKKSG